VQGTLVGQGVIFSPDSARLAYVTEKGPMKGDPNADRSVPPSPEKGAVVVQELASGREVLRRPGNLARFSPDGNHLACARWYPGEVVVWNLATRRPVLEHRIPGHIRAIAYSPDGRLLVFTIQQFPRREASVWVLRPGEEPLSFQDELLDYSTDGRYLAFRTTANYWAWTVWDVTAGKQALAVALTDKDGPAYADSVRFSPGVGRVVYHTRGTAVRSWDVASGQELSPIQAEPPAHGQLHFSPDGKRLAAAHGNTLRLWHLTQERSPAGNVAR
jgi:WD40 repeat protein